MRMGLPDREPQDMETIRTQRRRLGLECLLFFFILPLLLYPIRHRIAFTVVHLGFIIALGCYIHLRRHAAFDDRRFWRVEDFRRHIGDVLLFFFPVALLLTVTVYFFFPDLFLAFPKHKPLVWLAVLVFYPIVAAYPQEIIFRAFFFHRYGDLFPNPAVLILANALSFGLAHIFYGNWVAPVFSGVGGILFGYRYLTARSVVAPALEHGLWGNFLFTVGIGWYLYSGSIR